LVDVARDATARMEPPPTPDDEDKGNPDKNQLNIEMKEEDVRPLETPSEGVDLFEKGVAKVRFSQFILF